MSPATASAQGRRNRRVGSEAERAAVVLLRANGHLSAARIRSSSERADFGDLTGLVAADGGRVVVEVKALADGVASVSAGLRSLARVTAERRHEAVLVRLKGGRWVAAVPHDGSVRPSTPWERLTPRPEQWAALAVWDHGRSPLRDTLAGFAAMTVDECADASPTWVCRHSVVVLGAARWARLLAGEAS